jgi:hypothetical protein
MDAGRVGPEFVVSASPEPLSATIAGVCDGMGARALAGTTTKSHLGPGRKMAAFKLLFDLPGTFVPAFSPRAILLLSCGSHSCCPLAVCSSCSMRSSSSAVSIALRCLSITLLRACASDGVIWPVAVALRIALSAVVTPSILELDLDQLGCL